MSVFVVCAAGVAGLICGAGIMALIVRREPPPPRPDFRQRVLELGAELREVAGAVGRVGDGERLERELFIAASRACTGVAAAWCPVCGTCTCPDRERAKDHPDCLLHGDEAFHAAASVAEVAGGDEDPLWGVWPQRDFRPWHGGRPESSGETG